jgi:hypothetical protein
VLSSPFPFFSGGNTELSVTHLNHMMEQMRRQSRLLSAAPVLINQTGEGWQVRLVGFRGIWAVAGGHEGNARYSWYEAQIGPDGWGVRAGGRSGGGLTAAREANGRTDVTPGEILWLSTDEGSPAFVAPFPVESAPTLVWARIDGPTDGGYAWSEVTYRANDFEEVESGRGTRTGDTPAVEVNGLSVPVDSIVVVRITPAGAPCVFEYGGSDPGFWAVLLREANGSVYEADLAGATGGSWTLTFDPGEDAAPGATGGSVTLSATGSVSAAQAALDALTAGNVTVSGSPGALVFTFSGDLVGDSGASLSGAGGGLEVPAPAEGTGAATFSFTRTTTGRDLPFTDGKGGYAWVRAEFDAFGRLRPEPGGDGSVWPTGLALEANAIAVVPEGSVVRAVPRATEFMRRRAAESRPEFEDWTQEELDSHFFDVDAGGGWLSGAGVSFEWSGGDSFWAELTDEPDDAGLYPFRVVHLGGRDRVANPATEPTDFPTAAELRETFLDGAAGVVELVDTPIPENDRTWVGSRPGGREITGLAQELFARTGFEVGTVVRVYVNPVSGGGVAFTFSGPPLSLWVTLGGAAAVEGEAAGYRWTELDPPDDPLTGEPKAARSGVAAEIDGVTGIPAATVVNISPDGAGGWRFRHQPDAADGGRDCRLLNWLGGATATIVGGAGDPGATGRVVDVAFAPTEDAVAVRTGFHVGYRAPGSSVYKIVAPVGLHSDRVEGYLSAGAQTISGMWRLLAGSLYSTGASETPPFLPPDAFRANCVLGTSETYTPGWAPLKSDGALKISGGPQLIATGAALDLQGAVWAAGTGNTVSRFVGTLPQPPHPITDGPTGTIVVGGVAGAAAGSITLKGGLYVSSVNPGARPAMFSGTFQMKNLAGVTYNITVTSGIVSAIAPA